MTLTVFLALLTLGCCTGFLAGLLGIGGGMVLVPFLTLLLEHQGVPVGLSVKMAVATSLATICFTSVSSVRAHHQRGAVRWDIVALLAPGIVIGSLGGSQIAKSLPSTALALLFAGFVGYSATQMLRGKKPKPSRQLPGGVGLAGAGAGIGAVSALVGAGGGFVSVPFMVWCNVAMHQAVATSAALGFPIALAGTVGYVFTQSSVIGAPPGSIGYVNLPALAGVSLASVFTAPWGARTAHGMDVARLKKTFALMLYGLAAYMLFKGLSAGLR